MDYQIGSIVGDYEIVKQLGAGGMGEVYQVRNTISGRIEAMKVLLSGTENNPELADRFMREIKVLAGLEHPNIACLRTAMRVDKNVVMIMEFVEGSTLDQILHRGRIPTRKGVDYIRQVLSALAYAHERGIIHRDIKPANMMLTPAGVVKLMDFGIARIGEDRTLTKTGQTVGSLFYMSPEQINNTQTLDARSDLYSVGISLYEMVTGARPFHADSDFSIMKAHLQDTPVPPIQVDSSLPETLSDIILMSISKDPLQRFQTAEAFRRALQNVLEALPEVEDASNVATAALTAMPPTPPPLMPPGLAPTMVLGAAAAAPPPIPQQMRPAALAPAPRPAPAPVLTPAASALPPPVAAQSSRRGLYMVAGSLATVLILVLAAMQLPKMFKTSASGGSAFPSGQSAAGAPSLSSGTSGSSQQVVSIPSTETLPPPNSAAAGGSTAAGKAPQRPATTQTASAAKPAGNGNGGSAANSNSQGGGQQQAQGQTAAQTPPPQQPAGPSPAVVAELKELRHRQSLMAVRIGGIQGSIRQLQQQQANSGLGMSSEIVASDRRMEMLMDKAEREIRAGDPEAAKGSLDAAERELEKLEARFGR